MKTFLVSGGRSFDDKESVFFILDLIMKNYGIGKIVHGACQDKNGILQGADGLADEWAKKNGIEVAKYPALWNKYGKSAGPRRNRMMVDRENIDYGILFPGGAGTADMKSVLVKNNIKFFELKVKDHE